MNISEIEKEFEKEFPYRFLETASKDKVKSFLCTSLLSLLDGLEMKEIESTNDEFTFGDTNFNANAVGFGQNLVIGQLNEKLKELKQ